jgi:2-oxoglutarate dehydrogenase E2 component (dihydrolipoamide succinyltransferase)
MAAEIRVPEMGESIVEATVGKWLKQPGDPVNTGEPVLELETEKVNLEVPSPQDGVLSEMLRPEGETVRVGEVLGTVAEGAAPQRPAAEPPEQREPPTRPPEREPAREEAAQRIQAAAPEEERATPVARKMAQSLSVDLSQVKGTGSGGRITQEDVERYVSARLAQEPRAKPAAPEPSERPEHPEAPVQERAERQEVAPGADTREAPAPTAPPAPGRYEERVKLSRRRQTIARRLMEAHQTTVMTTTYNEIDLSAVVELRSRRRKAFQERYEIDLGFMSFFVKAVVAALKTYPKLNTELDGEELVYKYYYDIGIAVSSEEGLVVPVLREAEKKNFAEIEKAIADLAQRTREKKLTLPELSGGTFTITNGGVFGSLLSAPVLNPPQVGILGTHRIMERLVAVAGEAVVCPMMYVALTYDHRVVDGQEAVQFLVRVKELLEDPARMLLDT